MHKYEVYDSIFQKFFGGSKQFTIHHIKNWDFLPQKHVEPEPSKGNDNMDDKCKKCDNKVEPVNAGSVCNDQCEGKSTPTSDKKEDSPTPFTHNIVVTRRARGFTVTIGCGILSYSDLEIHHMAKDIAGYVIDPSTLRKKYGEDRETPEGYLIPDNIPKKLGYALSCIEGFFVRHEEMHIEADNPRGYVLFFDPTPKVDQSFHYGPEEVGILSTDVHLAILNINELHKKYNPPMAGMELHDSINPIKVDPDKGMPIWGQKTL
jgi:hypothetical protein